MTVYNTFGTRKTKQTEKVPGRKMVKNAAGGYVFEADKWLRLSRFLILGTDKGTYYTGAVELTRDNANVVIACLAEDPKRTVDMIADISYNGRAISNSPAIFALAMATSDDLVNGDADRRYAWSKLSTVARIGTHNFEFVGYREQFGGWGKLAREYESKWYNDMPIGKLAYQAVKYQQRNGWSHADILRLAHPEPQDNLYNALYGWIVGKTSADEILVREIFSDDKTGLEIVWAFEQAKRATTSKEIVDLIENYGLPREAIPTQWLNEKDVWQALLTSGRGMPLTAMIRNLGKMTAIGILDSNFGDNTKFVVDRLGDAEYIHRSRVHPMSLLVAQKVYEQGHGDRGSLRWPTIGKIVDSLDGAFYMAFDNVEPTGKKICLAIDGSGSMQHAVRGGRARKNRYGSYEYNETPIRCRDAAVAMALVTANVEPYYEIVGYTYRDNVKTVPITPRQRLSDAIRTFERGVKPEGTDCALPYLYAHSRGVSFDAFISYTDNETWAGTRGHPFQALDEYRKGHGEHVQAVMVAMTATMSRLSDPEDVRSLEVVGFDTSTPQAISEFLR